MFVPFISCRTISIYEGPSEEVRQSLSSLDTVKNGAVKYHTHPPHTTIFESIFPISMISLFLFLFLFIHFFFYHTDIQIFILQKVPRSTAATFPDIVCLEILLSVSRNNVLRMSVRRGQSAGAGSTARPGK